MIKSTRLPALFLVLCLILTFCACGGVSSTGSGWQDQYDLGIRYLSEGNYAEAVIAFTAAIEIDPKNPVAYLGRAQATVFSGETEENLSAALADYEKAKELGDNSADLWLGLADIYIRRGDYDKALEILKEGLDKTGGDEAIAGKIAEIESGTITDSSGNTRRMSQYDASGNLTWYHEYTYNAQGQESGVTAYDGNGTQIGHLELTYAADGQPLNTYGVYDDTGEVFAIVCEYDAAGQKSKETHYNTDGTMYLYKTYEYDGEGKAIRENNFTPDGTPDGYVTTEYNENGDWSKMSFYDSAGVMECYQTWEYNDEGNPLIYTQFSADGTKDWYQLCEYNEEGELISETWYNGDGTVENVTTYE